MNEPGAAKSRYVFLSGLLLGFILFCIVYGVKILDPSFDDWLMMDRDTTQHYIGWLYYRASDWHFPIGLIDGISAPYKVSVIYSDSLPLFAVFFKLLSPLLPETFQYFGLYGIISYGLMGGFSALLLHHLTKRPIASVAFSVLFTLSPYILHRMFIHTALAGHWVIIAAIYIWFSDISRPSYSGINESSLASECRIFAKLKRKNAHRPARSSNDVSQKDGLTLLKSKHSITRSDWSIICWAALLFITSAIHLYLVAMVYIFCFLDALETFIETKKLKQSLITLAVSFVLVMANLALLGAFYGGVAAGAGGFGVFGATMLTFFDAGCPDFSGRILPNLPEGMYQFEGYGYLGAGILLVCLICIIFRIISRTKFRDVAQSRLKFWLGISAALLFYFWAIFPNITLGENIGEPGVHNLFSFWMPEIIYNLLSILRCNGRFIWPCCYLIYIGAITYFLHAVPDPNASAGQSAHLLSPMPPLRTTLTALIIALQLFDLSLGIYNIHSSIFFTGRYEAWYKTSGKAWDELLETRPHVVYMKFHIERGTRLGYAIARKALDAGGDINTFYLARDLKEETEDTIEGYRAELASGRARPDVIYIFPEDANIPGEYGLYLYKMDGVIAGISEDTPDILEFKGVEAL